tara:strand:- start:1664 stop:2110 length:447 start_codon:yes stop_codon:yes gene_type:complete
MNHLKIITIALLMGMNLSAHAQAYKKFFNDVDRSELLILGTFHFKDSGLDGYKPKTDVNIMAPERQQELNLLLRKIKAYAPTKIALEVNKSRQQKLDTLYSAYLAGSFDLSANEIYQVGFKLARMLGHERVYAVYAYKSWANKLVSGN